MAFIKQLRSETNYPTFRVLMQISVGLCYLAAFGLLLGAGASGRTGAIVISMIALIAFLVIVHALYEAMMMVADIADATVATAARHDQHAEPTNANLNWDAPASLPRGNPDQ